MFHRTLIFIVSVSILALLLVYACTVESKEPPKSMDEIRKEQGLPVTIEIIKPTNFSKELRFFGQLSGIIETTKGAPIGGKIEKINVKVGTWVNQGQIIMQFPTDVPQLQYEQVKHTYEIAKKTYERMKNLLQAGETSQANFDASEAQYLIAKRNYEAQKQLIFIEAPVSGTIVKIYPNVGDFVRTDAPLFTIAQLNKMKVRIWLNEYEVNQIQKGMNAKFSFAGKDYEGKITEISLSMDRQKQAFYAEIEFDNSKNELKSGITVEIIINIENKNNTIIIPRNLIISEGDKFFVFVENNGKAEKREILTGSQSGAEIEILSGLNNGDKLINCCMSLLDDGIKVKVTQNL